MIDPIGEALEPDAKLWRYIRLSTLMLMLTKKHVFVPSIEILRKSDPLESTIVCDQTTKHFEQLDEKSKQWLRRARKGSRQEILRTWMEEIRWRRCAWCWHEGSLESMALWKLYAREGVAICTTPNRLFDCLKSNKRVKAAGIGRVHYCSDREGFAGSDITVLRPYMIKQSCYAFENEVRVILPTSKRHLGGLTIEIEPWKVLEEVAISPYMPESEAAALRELLHCWWPAVHCEQSGALATERISLMIGQASEELGYGEVGRRWFDGLRHRAGVAKFGITSRLPQVMKRI